MKKHILLLLALAAMQMPSFADGTLKDSTDSVMPEAQTKHSPFVTLYNMYHEGCFGWDSNWFLGGQVGTAMLLGSPVGCGDMFDRMMPAFNIYGGKWINQTVGFRASVSFGDLKNSDFEKFDYASAHADLLYNVASHFHDYNEGMPRWDVIPYLGVGIAYSGMKPGGLCVCNGQTRINHPFTFNYGVQVQYRFSERAHVTAELGGLTTYQSFDGKGDAARFGDNILSLSVGLSYTIGKVGFAPTTTKYAAVEKSNLWYRAYDKGKTGMMDGDSSMKHRHNSYSGLNSLRKRLNGDSAEEYAAGDSIVTVGIPVYFFFKLNSDEFVDDCQMINIDEIAKLVKERGVKLKITGAADSATGTPEINSSLAKARAKRIAKELKGRGVDLDNMKGFSCGGINTYEPIEANRFSKVVITE